MKYIKHIFESNKDDDYKRYMDTILSIDKVIKQDFKNTFNKHYVNYSLESVFIENSEGRLVLSISHSIRKNQDHNHEIYLSRIKEQDIHYGGFKLEECVIQYTLGFNTNDPTLVGLDSTLEKLHEKYHDVVKESITDNYDQIRLSYKLEDYLNLIGDNYKKINK
tara:strand:- start:1698 stop:2189 length:492 start_codon:yes stop_codon:yes gene_type:complete